MAEREKGVPKFNTLEERHAYVNRVTLERHAKYLLPEGCETEFLENPEKLHTGILVGYIGIRNEVTLPVVLGIVDQFGNAHIGFSPLPIGHGDWVRTLGNNPYGK